MIFFFILLTVFGSASYTSVRLEDQSNSETLEYIGEPCTGKIEGSGVIRAGTLNKDGECMSVNNDLIVTITPSQ